jgi:hypothetical protein
MKYKELIEIYDYWMGKYTVWRKSQDKKDEYYRKLFDGDGNWTGMIEKKTMTRAEIKKRFGKEV